MKHSEILLDHFFSPRNVGFFSQNEANIGRAIVGSYENGALIDFQVKINNGFIQLAKFKAYGPAEIIAGCSYVCEWIEEKSLEAVGHFSFETLMTVFEMSSLKIHYAILVADALKNAIADYHKQGFLSAVGV